MLTAKFEVVKFDRKINFTLWQVWMHAVLVQSGVQKALKGTSVGYHINEFESLIMDLQNLDVKIDDEDQALLLLCSLPSSYRHLRETILYGKDTISLKDVKTALETKEKIDHEITGQSSNSQA
ncbi:hypothetical protein ACOSP7_016991 [Xanthoceras sorbifolium]